MKPLRATRLLAAFIAGTLLVAACGDDDDDTTATTAAESAETTAAEASASTAAEEPDTTAGDAASETTAAEESTETTAAEASAESWSPDLELCVDPSAAEEPIEGTVKIGSVMPLSGGPAVLFTPVAEAFRAYIDYANEQQLLGDLTLEVTIEDDQYSKDLTPAAVAKQIGEGVHLFSSIIGTANNAAVRDTLNDECIPQLNALTGSPAWGDAENYEWTTGGLPTYDLETQIYAEHIAETFPEGATTALFYVNSEFGQIYVDTLHEIGGDYGIEIVDEQSVAADDSNLPTSQLTSIAAKQPQVILAVPLGLGCKSFLEELAAKKAENPGWNPVLYVTYTCGSNSFFLNLSGAAADGLISSSPTKDVNDPKNAADPGVKPYIDAMAARGASDKAADGVAGWSTGESTVAIIKQAMESEGGLTRASIMEAARNIELASPILRDGVVYRSMGTEDPIPVQAVQVLQYDADTKTFTDLGPVNTSFES